MAKIAIIGAGPAGLGAAYGLSSLGHYPDIYEKTDALGGLSGTISLWGQRVDYGPHRFLCNNVQINKIWNELLKDEMVLVNRHTRILYQDKFFHYPLQALDALSKLKPWESFLCILSYIRESAKKEKKAYDFESLISRKFGKRLYRIFFKNYSEKLWGLPCTKLDSDFGVQRIRDFSLFSAILGAVGLSSNKHRTIVEQFAYPYFGSGVFYQKMADRCALRGCKFHMNKGIKSIIIKDNKANGIKLESGEEIQYDHIISSMPLTELLAEIPDLPPDISKNAKKLKYRSTVLVYHRLRGGKICPDHWIYIHSPGLHAGRLTNFRNWSSGLYRDDDTTVVAIEYWCDENDGFWLYPDEKIQELSREELLKTGLISSKDQILNSHTLKVAKTYPRYHRGYKESLGIIKDYLKDIQGLYLIGRNGTFKYNNQDHSLLMGLYAAENIALNKDYDLWKINSDCENYMGDGPLMSLALGK